MDGGRYEEKGESKDWQILCKKILMMRGRQRKERRGKMAGTTTTKSQTDKPVKWAYKKYTFNEICEPGCYVVWPTGDLIRIPELGPNNRPFYHMVSRGTLWFVKISDDPYIPLNEARYIAADWDLPVNF